MTRKLFPVTMLAIAVLLALGRCAPTVATPTPRPPTLAPTPAADQLVTFLSGTVTFAPKITGSCTMRKSKSEMKEIWDYAKPLSASTAEQASRPRAETGCNMPK